MGVLEIQAKLLSLPDLGDLLQVMLTASGEMKGRNGMLIMHATVVVYTQDISQASLSFRTGAVSVRRFHGK